MESSSGNRQPEVAPAKNWVTPAAAIALAVLSAVIIVMMIIGSSYGPVADSSPMEINISSDEQSTDSVMQEMFNEEPESADDTEDENSENPSSE